MMIRRAAACLLLTTLLVSPAANAASRAKARRVATEANAEQPGRDALRDAVKRHLQHARVLETLDTYTVAPALVQLRRYVEPGRKLKLVCIVELTIQDQRGVLLARVRGSATTIGASPSETLDAAAELAVGRLPAALQTLRERGADLAQVSPP